MKSEEELDILEANNLITAVAQAYTKGSPVYEDISIVEFVPYKNIAITVIASEPGISKIDIANRGFALGAYLGIQYAKIKSMMENRS